VKREKNPVSNEAYQAAEQLCAWLRGEAPPVTDWNAVIVLAARQGLASVLYKQLKAAGGKALVPPESWTLLQETYFDSAGRCLRRQHQIARVLRAFQEAGIPVITLKGPHLGAVVYDDPALRPMQDLDVLLKPEDLQRAEDLLRAAGYTLYGDRAEYEREHFHFHYHLPDPAELPVELHWHLLWPDTPGVTLEMDELWERAQPLSIAGMETQVLAPEDLLLYLCLHTAYIHGLEGGLKTCYDLRQMALHFAEKLNWSQVQSRAIGWGCSKQVYLTLRLSAEILNAPIPVNLLTTLCPVNFDERLVQWAKEWITLQNYALPVPEYENWARLSAARNKGEKAKVLLQACFPSKQVIAKLYNFSEHSALLYAQYLRYWVQLVREHAPRVWHWLRRDHFTEIWIQEQAYRRELQQQKSNEEEILKAWLAS